MEDGAMTALTFVRMDDISANIRREVLSDPKISVDSLQVEDRNGEVNLNGVTETYAARLFAEAAARRVPGLRGLQNDIRVVIPRLKFRADSEIADAVRYTFKWNVLLQAQRLNCVVADGWVLIRGNVSAEYQKHEAEASISHIAGVKGIVNDVVVAG
jgi:osmotically-inducible protein OsmY